MVKYRYFVTFLYLNVFFFFNLRFLQLSVSILGELGTLKKSIRTMSNETFRIIFGVMLGKENEIFCYLLYYETFW